MAMKPENQLQPSPMEQPIYQTRNTDDFVSAPASAKSFSGWALLPLRLFLAVTFVYAGVQKITDPQFFHKATPGYIGNQIIGFAHGSPLHDLLMRYVLPRAVLAGWAVALGEIAIGLGVLFGVLFRPAAFFGALLSIVFFLTASWHVYPYFYGADIVFVFGWLTLLLNGPRHTGMPAADTLLLGWCIKVRLVKEGTLLESLFSLLLGGVERPAARPAAFDIYTASTRKMGRIAQSGRQTRRGFLAGAVTGGASVLGLTVLGYLLRGLTHPAGNAQTGVTATATSSSVPAASATQAGGTAGATQSGSAIAQVQAVPKNTAASFTIPSSGDPGILIHLANDQFVAYDASCTHAGCEVDYDSTSQHLICPCHGATFDPALGASVLQGPAERPLTSVSISIDNSTGRILLK